MRLVRTLLGAMVLSLGACQLQSAAPLPAKPPQKLSLKLVQAENLRPQWLALLQAQGVTVVAAAPNIPELRISDLDYSQVDSTQGTTTTLQLTDSFLARVRQNDKTLGQQIIGASASVAVNSTTYLADAETLKDTHAQLLRQNIAQSVQFVRTTLSQAPTKP